MDASREHPCPMCGAKYNHECGIRVLPHHLCKLCHCAVYRTEEGYWRHANDPFDDASAFCDKYGYPLGEILHMSKLGFYKEFQVYDTDYGQVPLPLAELQEPLDTEPSTLWDRLK